MKTGNRYNQIIENVFLSHYRKGIEEFEFEREEFEQCAAKLGIKLPKNLGDLIYSFRYRVPLPEQIVRTATEGKGWAIQPAGKGRYRFILRTLRPILPNELVKPTKVLDSTPGLIGRYALSDEQALLAKVRYNRLLDTFTRVTCYSLQSHLRTFVPNIGQVETDELYVGVDRRGAHYVFPVQAKGGKDRLDIIQIEQDLALCQHKFPALICRAIGAQFLADNFIALFMFGNDDGDIEWLDEKHYRLVSPSQLSAKEIAHYRALDTEE